MRTVIVYIEFVFRFALAYAIYLIRIWLVIGAAMLLWMLIGMLIPAVAQTATVYGPDGRVQTRTQTDSRGNTTIYDASGNVAGRTTTSGTTTTIYGADGRKAGSVTQK
jgi:YD repeat-containing protein